jgi:anti-anti-sigma factor
VQKLNLFVTDDVKKEVIRLFKRPNLKLLINMEGIQFIDSSGFALLLSAAKEAHRTGGQIIYCNISEPVMHLFEVLQLHKAFKIVATPEEAIYSFK